MPTHHRGSAREVRALDAYIKINRAAESLQTVLDAGLARDGMGSVELGVLEALLHLGAMSQGELGRRLLRSKASLSEAVGRLEREGLVARAQDPGDRRSRIVALTPAGRRRIRRVFPQHAARITDAFAALSPAEQEELGRLCRKLGLSLAPGAATRTRRST